MSEVTPENGDHDRNRRRDTLAALGVLAVLVLGVVVWNVVRDDDGTAVPTFATVTSSTVVYEVEGSVKWADVTMQTPTGTSQQTPDVPLTNAETGVPGLTFTFRPAEFVYISAQKKSDGGRITCRISVNGHVVAENTSSAAYGIATCQGSA